MPNFSLEQKRLEILRRQLYGGSRKVKATQSMHMKPERDSTLDLASISQTIQLSSNTRDNAETLYLSQDLKKVFLLSSIALGVQLLLYLSLKMNLIHLGF